MKKIFVTIILSLHMGILIIAAIAYSLKTLEHILPIELREEQFGAYVTRLNCPDEVNHFQYCLFYGDKIDTIVIGDSSILAVAESGVYSNVLFLGAGSCPIIKGLVVSFSTSSCASVTKEFYENTEVQGILSNAEKVILLHRSEYLREIAQNSYIEKLIASINYLKLLGLDRFILELEVGRIDTPPTTCHRIFSWKKVGCTPNQVPEFRDRVEALSEANLGSVKIHNLNFDRLTFSDFKDAVHLTGSAYRSIWLENRL